jgi:hypothetical protein
MVTLETRQRLTRNWAGCSVVVDPRMTAMSLRSQLALATLSILATAALAATAADAHPGQGQRPQSSTPVVQDIA